MNGFVAAEQISQISPKTKVLFVSAQRSFEVVREALKIGGGMIAKTEAHRNLVPMIRAIFREESVVRFELAEGALNGSDEDQ